MSSNNYMNLFMNALITDRRVQEKYVRYLDAVLAQEGIGVDDIVGVGEEGTGGALDPLYVVHKQAVSVASQVSRFNKRIEVRRLCPIASIANLRATEEGFKGRDVTLTATDPRGNVVLKIVWGLGGPDWVEPLIMRQRQHMVEVISEAMDGLSEAAARPSVASASSKAGALMDWAADLVKAAGVPMTNQTVEEVANIAAATLGMRIFLPLAQIDDYNKLYPGGGMPDGTSLQTFDDLYARVVARVGSSQLVDREIDKKLASVWGEWVQRCREDYAA